MAEDPDPERLKQLSERLAEARDDDPKPEVENHFTAAQAGWRMVTELVVGLLLGAAIGYGLDAVFGTEPWFLIVFCMLGFAAGIRVMLKTAEEIQKVNAPDGGEGT
ncbi:MAG: AtpZ/AtpI family protein [Pseudomonadota bacterium]